MISDEEYNNLVKMIHSSYDFDFALETCKTLQRAGELTQLQGRKLALEVIKAQGGWGSVSQVLENNIKTFELLSELEKLDRIIYLTNIYSKSL